MRSIPGIMLMLLGSCYFTFYICRLLKTYFHLKINMPIIISTFLLMIVISLPTRNVLLYYTVIYIHILVFCIIWEVIRFIISKDHFMMEIIPFGLAGLFLLYGYFNMNHVVKTSYTFTSSKIDELRIIQMSDIHMSNTISVEDLDQYCKEISSYQPDFVFLTGDIFDENTPKDDLIAACKTLGSIETKEGVYYVFGNHDSATYRTDSEFNEDDVRYYLKENNVHVLEDEVVTIGKINIIGRKDANFWGTNPRLSIAELMKGIDKNQYVIVLDHQPLDLESNADLTVDLQLSGHTHGGQLFPMRFFQSLTSDTLIYGNRTINQFEAITSSGMSGWGSPIKTGAKSEYVIIDINKEVNYDD